MWNYDPTDDPTDDCFHSGGDLYRIMTEEQKETLIGNTARNIASCSQTIKYRHAVHCYWADRDYGERMTAALKLNLDTVKELAKGDHKALVAATLPGGRFNDKPCDMSCMSCEEYCIDEKYM